MTPDELRNLDAQVAVEVMGWHRSKGGALHRPGTDGKNINHYADVPPYSTDIAAAWQVVERVDLFGALELVLTRDNVNNRWNVIREEHIEYEPSQWHLVSQEYSAPLAICLAALNAVRTNCTKAPPP